MTSILNKSSEQKVDNLPVNTRNKGQWASPIFFGAVIPFGPPLWQSTFLNLIRMWVAAWASQHHTSYNTSAGPAMKRHKYNFILVDNPWVIRRLSKNLPDEIHLAICVSWAIHGKSMDYRWLSPIKCILSAVRYMANPWIINGLHQKCWLSIHFGDCRILWNIVNWNPYWAWGVELPNPAISIIAAVHFEAAALPKLTCIILELAAN